MSRVPTKALASAAAALAALAACDGGPSPTDAELSGLRLALAATHGAGGVVSVRFSVSCEGGTSEERIVPLESEGLPEGVSADLAGYTFADLFVVAPEGRCDVTATALDADGEPRIGCSPASTTVEVVPEVTTEVTLVVACTALPSGALDVAAAIDMAPVVDVLVVSPGLEVAPGEPVHLSVQAHDPDGDALAYAWSTSASAAKAAAELVQDGPEATFTSKTPGSYTVTVVVSDGAAKASATVTLIVSGG
jgi:hypothetical protein